MLFAEMAMASSRSRRYRQLNKRYILAYVAISLLLQHKYYRGIGLAIEHKKYTATWKMTNLDARLTAFSQALADNAVYTDPQVQATTWEQLVDYMEQFHMQIPGAYFVTTSFSSHHDRCIASWDMKTQDDVTIGSGTSYGEYDDQGKLVSMNGFF